MTADPMPWPMRVAAAFGAFACAIAVGMGAYAMHGALASHDRERLALSALFLFAHGLALAALAPAATSRLRQSGIWILALGMTLFSGNLALAALCGMAPALAPFGGSLLMLGWLSVAAGFVFG